MKNTLQVITIIAGSSLIASAYGDSSDDAKVKAIPKAQSPAIPQDQQKTKVTQPLGAIGLQLRFGYYSIYTSGVHTGFFNLTYKDQSLFSTGGTPPTATTIADDPIAYGDRPVTLNIANGATQFGGTVFTNYNALSIKDLLQQALGQELAWVPKWVRVSLAYDQQSVSNAQSNMLYGFEIAPDLSKLSQQLYKGNIGETFLAVGLAQEQHTAAATNTINAAEFRGRLGFGLGFVTSQQRQQQVQADSAKLSAFVSKSVAKKTSASLSRAIAEVQRFADKYGYNLDVARDNLASEVKIAPAFNSAQTRMEQLDATKAKITTTGQRLYALRTFLDAAKPAAGGAATPMRQGAAPLPPSEAILPMTTPSDQILKMNNQEQMLSTAIEFNAKAFNAKSDDENPKSPKDMPRWEIYADGDGAYGLDGSFGATNVRFMYSGNVKFTLDPTNTNSPFFQLRYENGFSRATPTARSNAFTFTVGLSF